MFKQKKLLLLLFHYSYKKEKRVSSFAFNMMFKTLNNIAWI